MGEGIGPDRNSGQKIAPGQSRQGFGRNQDKSNGQFPGILNLRRREGLGIGLDGDSCPKFAEERQDRVLVKIRTSQAVRSRTSQPASFTAVSAFYYKGGEASANARGIHMEADGHERSLMGAN